MNAKHPTDSDLPPLHHSYFFSKLSHLKLMPPVGKQRLGEMGSGTTCIYAPSSQLPNTHRQEQLWHRLHFPKPTKSKEGFLLDLCSSSYLFRFLFLFLHVLDLLRLQRNDNSLVPPFLPPFFSSSQLSYLCLLVFFLLFLHHPHDFVPPSCLAECWALPLLMQLQEHLYLQPPSTKLPVCAPSRSRKKHPWWVLPARKTKVPLDPSPWVLAYSWTGLAKWFFESSTSSPLWPGHLRLQSNPTLQAIASPVFQCALHSFPGHLTSPHLASNTPPWTLSSSTSKLETSLGPVSPSARTTHRPKGCRF